MIRLLIADDEPLIHVSIETFLRELQTDIAVFHAYNGAEMLAFLRNESVDAALVDIKMPGLSGLETISEAKKIRSDTLYYITTGYSEFEYAKKAISLGVTDYLLKPLSPEELGAVLEKVKADRARLDASVRDNFRAWLGSTVHRHNEPGLFPADYAAVALLLTFDMPEERMDIPAFASEYHAQIVSFPCEEGILLLAYAKKAERINRVLKSAGREAYPPGTSLFTTAVSADANTLSLKIHQILDRSALRVFNGLGTKYSLSVLSHYTAEDVKAAKDWVRLRDAYRNGDTSQYVSLATKMIGSLGRAPAADHLKMLAEFLGCFLKSGTPESTPHAIACALKNAENSILAPRGGDKLGSVIAYIDESYCNDISIATLAERFDLSPNYLSALLKKRLGMKFTDYLTSLRLSRAKQLLMDTNLSISEITAEVGYFSQSYFTKIFISKEQCTPGEFRHNHGK